MELNTTLFRKEPRFDTRLCKVEKILELSGSEFVHLKENLLEEYDFLIRYRDLIMETYLKKLAGRQRQKM
jgi:hypothetical protein